MYTLRPASQRAMKAAPTRRDPVPDSACGRSTARGVSRRALSWHQRAGALGSCCGRGCGCDPRARARGRAQPIRRPNTTPAVPPRAASLLRRRQLLPCAHPPQAGGSPAVLVRSPGWLPPGRPPPRSCPRQTAAAPWPSGTRPGPACTREGGGRGGGGVGRLLCCAGSTPVPAEALQRPRGGAPAASVAHLDGQVLLVVAGAQDLLLSLQAEGGGQVAGHCGADAWRLALGGGGGGGAVSAFGQTRPGCHLQRQLRRQQPAATHLLHHLQHVGLQLLRPACVRARERQGCVIPQHSMRPGSTPPGLPTCMHPRPGSACWRPWTS